MNVGEPSTLPAQQETRRISAQAVQALSWLKGEPEWVRQRRQEAWHLYQDTPMPRPTDEEWRRTDLSGLRLESCVPFAEPSLPRERPQAWPPALQALLPGSQSRDGLILQQDSAILYQECRPELARRGLLFLDLEQAVRQYPELVQPYFMTEAVPPAYSKFAALHGAFWSGGVLLYVPEGLEITLPLRAACWLGTPQLGGFHHTLIIAERGSRVTYIDEYASPDLPGQSLSCNAVEVYLKEGAQLRYYSLQAWGRQAYSFSIQRALLEKDSSFTFLQVVLGGSLSKANTESLLLGPGASTLLLGLDFGDASQLIDHHTLQDHIAPHTSSDLLFKGALKDQAKLVYYGLVRVHKGARQADANQTNRNLLLSERSKADSMPVLEIQTSDIRRCSHAAATGPVDENQLFYLMSRGLSEAQAQHLLVNGFFAPVVERIPLEEVREKIYNGIAQKLTLGPGR